MPIKTLSISEEAYNSLKALKRGNESFTEVILRLTEKERKGLHSVLEWLHNLSPDEEQLLDQLADSVEKVVNSRDQAQWRSIDR
jgi:predicted CopG family antitoxin